MVSITVTVLLLLPIIILAMVIYWQYNLISTLIDKLNYIPPKLEWRKQLNEDIDNILEENNEKDNQKRTNQSYTV